MGLGHAGITGLQDQECLGETREGEHDADDDDAPELARQAEEIRRRENGRGRGPVIAGGWLANGEDDEQHGERGGERRPPEHGAKIVSVEDHEGHRQQRSEKGSDGVERLPDPIGRSPLPCLGQVGDERVARGAPDALADAIDETGEEHPPGRAREWEERLAQRGEPISGGRDPLSFAEPVRQSAGEHLAHRGGGLADPFDEPDGDGGSAERAHQEHGQEAVDQLRRGVHGERHQPEDDDVARHRPPRAFTFPGSGRRSLPA